ncbi:hypothetical protein ACFRFL_09395, partial [Streptomyces sp. NPDC056708]
MRRSAAARRTAETDSRTRMIAVLVAGLLAGYGIAIPVGAVGTYLVGLTARTSLRTGACAALGVATADGLYAVVAVGGGVPLCLSSSGAWRSGFVEGAVAEHRGEHAGA